jgi:hypothetical protein
MKKIFYFFIIICSIASRQVYCQNNLEQATNSILNNATKLKEKIETLQAEHTYQQANVTVEQIQNILIVQKLTENPGLAQNISARKTAHQNLELMATWFEQEKTTDDWMNYFAIHNQTIAALEKELKSLKSCPQICKEITERIITVFTHALQNLYFNNGKPSELKSLVYVYQDYQNLFKRYGTTL